MGPTPPGLALTGTVGAFTARRRITRVRLPKGAFNLLNARGGTVGRLVAAGEARRGPGAFHTPPRRPGALVVNRQWVWRESATPRTKSSDTASTTSCNDAGRGVSEAHGLALGTRTITIGASARSRTEARRSAAAPGRSTRNHLGRPTVPSGAGAFAGGHRDAQPASEECNSASGERVRIRSAQPLGIAEPVSPLDQPALRARRPGLRSRRVRQFGGGADGATEPRNPRYLDAPASVTVAAFAPRTGQMPVTADEPCHNLEPSLHDRHARTQRRAEISTAATRASRVAKSTS